jgi:integrase/recombinase XerD
MGKYIRRMKEHDTAKKIDAGIDSALKDFNEDSKAMADAIGWKNWDGGR